jgi:8-oxo-dGTP pyrophosphatase MutT (NUDIX family)
MNPSDPSLFGNDPIGPVTEAEQFSAGGVLYRHDIGKPKVCLVSKRMGRVWAFPKGRMEVGETPEQTALREVREETGHAAEIVYKLDEINYFFMLKEPRTFYRKTVTFYLMRLVQENVRQRDEEADQVSWLDIGEANRRLTYINEKKLLKKAQGLIF